MEVLLPEDFAAHVFDTVLQNGDADPLLSYAETMLSIVASLAGIFAAVWSERGNRNVVYENKLQASFRFTASICCVAAACGFITYMCLVDLPRYELEKWLGVLVQPEGLRYWSLFFFLLALMGLADRCESGFRLTFVWCLVFYIVGFCVSILSALVIIHIAGKVFSWPFLMVAAAAIWCLRPIITKIACSMWVALHLLSPNALRRTRGVTFIDCLCMFLIIIPVLQSAGSVMINLPGFVVPNSLAMIHCSSEREDVFNIALLRTERRLYDQNELTYRFIFHYDKHRNATHYDTYRVRGEDTEAVVTRTVFGVNPSDMDLIEYYKSVHSEYPELEHVRVSHEDYQIALCGAMKTDTGFSGWQVDRFEVDDSGDSIWSESVLYDDDLDLICRYVFSDWYASGSPSAGVMYNSHGSKTGTYAISPDWVFTWA